MLSILLDYILDLTSIVIIPTVLASTYAADFNPLVGDFPMSRWYNDTWLIQFVNESQLVVVTSPLDATMRLVFSIGLVTTAWSIASILDLHRSRPVDVRVHALSTMIHTPVAIQAASSRAAPRWHTLVRWFMVICGIVVLVLHLHAVDQSVVPNCSHTVHPWWTSRPACALLHVDCSRHPTEDAATLIAAAIESVEAHWLRYLIIRHCQSLRVPTAVTKLHDVIGIKFYNTTVDAWDSRAALTAHHHPAIRFIFLVSTQLPNASVPVGLLADEFPPGLLDIEFVATNLDHLPDRVGDLWPSGLILHIEHSRLTAVPPVLDQLHIFACSLAGNAISIVPPSLLEMGIAVLTLSGNPMESLPDDVSADQVSTLREIAITWTNISVEPVWMDTAFLSRTVVFAGNTPLCDTLEHGTIRSGIVCDGSKHAEIGRYPRWIDLEVS
ncbi:hypothetical protein PINS_up004597 [Pythium insidiosum]|nr:hypothetical protein PINS_up004597 [Pythium insidiosum]